MRLADDGEIKEIRQQVLLLGPLLSIMGYKKMSILIFKPNKGLDFIKALFESEKVMPVIDKCFPLSAAAEAMQ